MDILKVAPLHKKQLLQSKALGDPWLLTDCLPGDRCAARMGGTQEDGRAGDECTTKAHRDSACDRKGTQC